MWKTSPVKSFADAQRIEATLSGTGIGSTVSIYPTVMNNVFGTKFKLVMGYKGSNEAMLAVERGEVEGHSTSWTALKVAHPDWIRDKSVSLLVQFSLHRHVDLPNLPTAVDLARNDEERQVLSAVMMMNGRRVPEALPEVGLHGFKDLWQDGGGGVIVEIDAAHGYMPFYAVCVRTEMR